MRAALAIALLAMLLGCSTAAYYAPESDANAQRGGNACTTLVAYQTRLGDTISLSAYAQPRPGAVHITIAFHVPRGESLQLLSPQFIINSDSGVPSPVNVASIASGSVALHIPIVKFGPTEPLLGTGRYEQLVPPYGPEDAFVVDLTLAAETLPTRLNVQLPKLLANGRSVTTSPMSFVLRSEPRLMCIQ